MAIFLDVKKQRFIFFITRLFLIFVNYEIFFQEYIEMELTEAATFFTEHLRATASELRIFFITSEGFFEWQKQNIAIITLLHADK